MPIQLLAAMVVIIALLCVWIWLNAKWIRNQAASDGSKESLKKDTPVAESSEQTVPRHEASENGPVAGTATRAPLTDLETETRVEGVEVIPESSTESNEETAGPSIEVVEKPQPSSAGVFNRSEHPFRLNTVQVPVFSEERWIKCFHRLTEDGGVLGWVAFHEDAVGASDREYETGFIDALIRYRKTLEDLRKEVGISQIIETSIVGDEGKMWFLSAVDDVWLALFVDRAADIEQLSKRLLTAGDTVEV